MRQHFRRAGAPARRLAPQNYATTRTSGERPSGSLPCKGALHLGVSTGQGAEEAPESVAACPGRQAASLPADDAREPTGTQHAIRRFSLAEPTNPGHTPDDTRIIDTSTMLRIVNSTHQQPGRCCTPQPGGRLTVLARIDV